MEKVQIPNLATPDIKKHQILWGFVKLLPRISILNYIGMLLHNLIYSAVLSGTELLQQNLLTSPEYYNLTTDDAQQLFSYIVIQDVVTKLLTVPFYGYLIDSWGRQKSLFLAYMLVAISYVLFPLYYYAPGTFTSPYWTCIGRFVYSNGAAILITVPFLGDYVEHKTKGKAISINIPLSSIGYLISNIILNGMSKKNLFYSYVVLFFIATIGGFGYTTLLKPGNHYYKSADPEHFHNPDEKSNLKLIKKYGSQNHWIYISFVFAVMAGAGTAMLIQIFNLFIQSFPSSDPVAVANSVMSVSNIGAAIISFLVGLVLDYVHPIYPCVAVFLLGSYGFFTSWLIKDPEDISMKLVALSVGVASSTTQLLANYNGFRYYPGEHRGYFFGISSVFVFLGTVIVAGVGGSLFKYCDINWPFYISGIISGISIVLFCSLYFKSLRKSKFHLQV